MTKLGLVRFGNKVRVMSRDRKIRLFIGEFILRKGTQAKKNKCHS